jgi:hypothetical protein
VLCWDNYPDEATQPYFDGRFGSRAAGHLSYIDHDYDVTIMMMMMMMMKMMIMMMMMVGWWRWWYWLMIDADDDDDDDDDDHEDWLLLELLRYELLFCHATSKRLSTRIRALVILTQPIWTLDAAYASDYRPRKAAHPRYEKGDGNPSGWTGIVKAQRGQRGRATLCR